MYLDSLYDRNSDPLSKDCAREIFHRLHDRSATLSEAQSGTGYKRARDIAGPAHPGALIAAKPRLLAMIQEAVMGGLLPKQPLVTRLAAGIEAATAACFE